MARRKFDAKKAVEEKRLQAEAAEVERDRVRHELHLSKAKRSASEWRALARGLRRELEVAEERLDVLLSLGEAPAKPLVIKPGRRSSGKSESVACIAVSDLHVEEEVRPDQVNGRNRYNLGIAEERLDKLWRGALRLLDTTRATSRVERMVVGILGDLYSGHIHEDLVEVTALSPIESLLWLQPRLVAGIDFLLERGELAKLDLVFKIGNHSRLTRKPRIATAEKHSLEWLLYAWIAQHYAGDPRVTSHLVPGYHTLTDLFGVRVRWHHGDWLNYQGGIGGLGVPLNKAIRAWNRATPADLDVLGHWHSYESSIGTAVVNGSGIGYSPYSVRIKADYEPPVQAFFAISEKHRAVTLRAPIFLE